MAPLYTGMKLTHKKSSQGFTLIELMITVSIIAILAAIAIPSYREFVRRNSEEQARQRILTLATELSSWRSKKLSYSGFVPKNNCSGTTTNCYSDTDNTFIYVPLGSDATNYKYKISIFGQNNGTPPLLNSLASACSSLTGDALRECNTVSGRSWYLIATPNRDNGYLTNATSFFMDNLGNRCAYDLTASKDTSGGSPSLETIAINNTVPNCTIRSGVTTW